MQWVPLLLLGLTLVCSWPLVETLSFLTVSRALSSPSFYPAQIFTFFFTPWFSTLPRALSLVLSASQPLLLRFSGSGNKWCWRPWALLLRAWVWPLTSPTAFHLSSDLWFSFFICKNGHANKFLHCRVMRIHWALRSSLRPRAYLIISLGIYFFISPPSVYTQCLEPIE